MVCRTVEEDADLPRKLKSYTETFEETCAYYMSIGMSYEEFWYGDAFLVKYYHEAYNYKRKEKNEELWLLGQYFAYAVGANLDNKVKYPKKPFDIYPKTEAEKKAEIEQKRNEVVNYFTNLKKKWDSKNGTDRQLNS